MGSVVVVEVDVGLLFCRLYVSRIVGFRMTSFASHIQLPPTDTIQWKEMKTQGMGRYLICIYLPVAMAAGVANLAIDKVIPEGAATIHLTSKLASNPRDQQEGMKTYIAAAIAAQPFEQSC